MMIISDNIQVTVAPMARTPTIGDAGAGARAILISLVLRSAGAAVAQSCAASDHSLHTQRAMLCNSFVGSSSTPWCDGRNVTASRDWPNQAVYMMDILSTLASTSTCLNTTYARETASWLGSAMGNVTPTGNFIWNWLVCTCLSRLN